MEALAVRRCWAGLQVGDLQSAMTAVPAVPAKRQHAGSPRHNLARPSAPTGLQKNLDAVKHHAAALAQAAAALECVQL